MHDMTTQNNKNNVRFAIKRMLIILNMHQFSSIWNNWSHEKQVRTVRAYMDLQNRLFHWFSEVANQRHKLPWKVRISQTLKFHDVRCHPRGKKNVPMKNFRRFHSCWRFQKMVRRSLCRASKKLSSPILRYL